MKRTLLLITCIVFSLNVIGQDTQFDLSFEVLNEATAVPLENAEISIMPYACGGVTGSNGAFQLLCQRMPIRYGITHIGLSGIV